MNDAQFQINEEGPPYLPASQIRLCSLVHYHRVNVTYSSSSLFLKTCSAEGVYSSLEIQGCLSCHLNILAVTAQTYKIVVRTLFIVIIKIFVI